MEESFDRFDQLVREDEVLAEFVGRIAADVEPDETSSKRTFDLLASGLSAVVIYALWRVAKVVLDRVEGRAAAETALERAQVAAYLRDELQVSGKQAAAIEAQIYEQIGQRSADDPVLKATAAAYKLATG